MQAIVNEEEIGGLQEMAILALGRPGPAAALEVRMKLPVVFEEDFDVGAVIEESSHLCLEVLLIVAIHFGSDSKRHPDTPCDLDRPVDAFFR